MISVSKSQVTATPGGATQYGCLFSWCCLTVVLIVALSMEIVSASLAKRTAFEAILSLQQSGDICLPVQERGEYVWTTKSSTGAGVFSNLLDGGTSGVEQLFGMYSLSSLSLLVRTHERNLSIDPQEAWQNFAMLQDSDEFDMSSTIPGGLWSWLLKVLHKCHGALSSGPMLFTGLRNASDTMMNRAIETKQNGIPDWIWENKVTLPKTYKCAETYNNKPLTLLAFDDVSNRCLRDQYKVIYIEGFYRAPYTPEYIASTIHSIVEETFEAQPTPLTFETPLEACPETLMGVMCPLWLAYMKATLMVHAGNAWAAQTESADTLNLTIAMSDWLYYGFHKDLFGKKPEMTSKTLKAAETLLCFYASVARSAQLAGDISSAQYRWLNASAARKSASMDKLWTYDSVATESLHNSLALGFQGAVGSTHILLDMWRQQQLGTIDPGDLACNSTLRRKFLRESLRRSSPGVPTQFATTLEGTHSMLHGEGTKQIRFVGGENHINMAAHSIPHRHRMDWSNPSEFNMEREEMRCPFAKLHKYNPKVARGGCGRSIKTEEPQALFAGTDPSVLNDSTTHPFCRDFREENVFLNADSHDYDLKTWITSNNGYIPFGIGYRRCPGETLMWRVFDKFIAYIDSHYDIHLPYPIEDGGELQRWALGVIPKNGLRMVLKPATTQRDCSQQ